MPGNTRSPTRGERGGTTTSTTPICFVTSPSAVTGRIPTPRPWDSAKAMTSPAGPEMATASPGASTWSLPATEPDLDWRPSTVRDGGETAREPTVVPTTGESARTRSR